MNKTFLLPALFISLLIFSCQPDEDLISPDISLIKKVKSTEILLRNNTWRFNDLIVTVKYEMRAIPLLANVADENGMVQPGEYNAYEIYGNYNRQNYYKYQFRTIQILADTTTENGTYNKVGYYNVLSPKEIRINPDSLGLATYTYRYDENDGLFTVTSDHLTNGTINDLINKKIMDAIYSGKPNDIANSVVDKILGNPKIHASVEQALYDLIHGKLEDISQNPEEISEKLASLIVEKLKETDWESLVYEKLVELLEKLKVENPEQKAEEIALQISNRIETNISQADIYAAILPIFQKFGDETLPALVPNLADAIYSVIARVFTEDNIYNKIYPAWIHFSAVDSVSILSLADTLGSVITNHFFDEAHLAAALEPFISTLRSTPNSKIPALAQDIIDQVLIPLVDSINSTFPDLNLEPDWNSVKPILVSALTAIKASIGNQSDSEAATALAKNIIGIMDLAISKGVETALFTLQDIPADQAAQVIAAWINNLVTVSEPQIVAFLEIKLNELADLFNAEAVSEEISAKIYARIMEVFGKDNIYNLILPVMQRLSDIDAEAAAAIITDWLFESGIIKDNITEEQVLAALTEGITGLIGQIDVDEATGKLVDLIMQSNIVQNVDRKVLKQMLEIKIYELLIELGKDINAIEKVEFSIKIY
jgi:hypothetical protein